MNARQAKRIALWMNGHYLIAADHYGLDDDQFDRMPEADLERLGKAQRNLGLELIGRSGLDPNIHPRDVVAAAVKEAERGSVHEDEAMHPTCRSDRPGMDENEIDGH